MFLEVVIFYSTIFTAALIFLNLARKWPSVMKKWEAVEKTLPPFKTRKDIDRMGFFIKAFTCIIGTFSLGMLFNLINLFNL